MKKQTQESRREQVARAAIFAAIVGPLLAQIAVGLLARLQDFFCPVNFLPIYAASFFLLAPGYYLIGRIGARLALRFEAGEMPRWMVLPALAAGGALAGVVYFEALAFAIGTAFADYRVLLAMPGLRTAISAVAALVGTWGFVFRPREYHALSLR